MAPRSLRICALRALLAALDSFASPFTYTSIFPSAGNCGTANYQAIVADPAVLL
jgi:hypothetical protein